MELVQPSIGLIFWMTLSFLILLFLLKKFAWKPILKAIENREKSIREALQTAENTKLEMKKIQQDNEQLLRQARDEREKMLRDAENLKSKIIAEAHDKAKTEFDRIVASAHESIQNEKMALIVDLKNQAALIAIEIAESLVREHLSDTVKNQQYIDKLVKDVKFN